MTTFSTQVDRLPVLLPYGLKFGGQLTCELKKVPVNIFLYVVQYTIFKIVPVLHEQTAAQ